LELPSLQEIPALPYLAREDDRSTALALAQDQLIAAANNGVGITGSIRGVLSGALETVSSLASLVPSLRRVAPATATTVVERS
jgi:hypothetical protein